MKFDSFDWDSGNWLKCQKHGVSIADIEAMFQNGPFIVPDIFHSDAEDRQIAVGRDNEQKMFAVVFTYRGHKIRPISARYMHTKEILKYERQKTSKA